VSVGDCTGGRGGPARTGRLDAEVQLGQGGVRDAVAAERNVRAVRREGCALIQNFVTRRLGRSRTERFGLLLHDDVAQSVAQGVVFVPENEGLRSRVGGFDFDELRLRPEGGCWGREAAS
jgi:hypothetical protein